MQNNVTTIDRPVQDQGTTSIPVKKRVSMDVPYIEGMRGLAAMMVVFYHAYHNVDKRMLSGASAHGHALLLACLGWMNNGGYAVPAFIVISGFCLMLPVVLSGSRSLPKGAVDFYRRRIRRILPPYYAALLLSAVGYALLGVLAHHHHGAKTAFEAPHVTKGQFLSHLFLVENCSAAWSHTIDGPMWSVAAESHIYVLFPLLLIPVWRRFGNLATIALAFAIGVLPHYFLRHVYYDYTYLISEFSLGMAAAVVCYSDDEPVRRWASKVNWGLVTLILGALYCAWSFTMPKWFQAGWEVSSLVAAFAASAIVCCRQGAADGGNFLRKIFESRILKGLGLFSYSIYLIHHPMLMVFCQLADHLHPSPAKLLALELGIGVPVILLCAYAFYLLFEKPFMSRRTATLESRKPAGAVS